MVLKVLSLIPWLGYGGYPWLGSALFFLLGTPFWFQGIIPCLLLKILLVKGALLLGPPIALGAFVLGQGSGLLIGKLLGIKLVLNALHYHSNGHQGEFKSNHWQALREAVGWKATRIRIRLPFLLKWRLHPTFSPPPHYDFYSFPPIRHVKYTEKPYGTYTYTQGGWDEGNNHVVDTSDWLSGPGPDYSSGASAHAPIRRAKHQNGTHVFPSESSAHAHYNISSGHKEDSGHERPLKSSISKEGEGSRSLREDVENFIRAEVHKLRSVRAGDTVAVGDVEEATKELINEQFARDLLESMPQNAVPEFIPLPEKSGKPKSITATPTGKAGDQDDSESMKNFVLSSLVQELNPMNFLPEPLVSLLSPTESNILTKSTEGGKRRQKRASTRDVKLDQVTHSVANDIRNLFSIISFLDISRCLEKMVCEIHSRGRKFTPRHLANSFEGNVIIAFRIMDSLMGNDKDKNVIKYRAAARLGEKHQSPEMCLKKFPACPVSSRQLISLGSEIAQGQESSA